MLLRVISANECSLRGSLLVPGVALVTLGDAGQGLQPLDIRLGGQPPSAPYGTVQIGPDTRPCHIAAFRLPDDALSGPLLIEADHKDHRPVLASELDADALAIAAELDTAGKRKLLDFLLSFCCPAFKLSRSAAFAQVCTRLAQACIDLSGKAKPLARVTSDLMLVEGVRADASSTFVILGRKQITRSRSLTCEGSAGLQVVPSMDAGDVIMALGAEPAAWTLDEAAFLPPAFLPPAFLPHVFFLPEGGSTSPALARNACAQALAGSKVPAARALLQEMTVLFPARPRRLADPAQPIAGEVELAIPDGAGGMFLSGWLRDPLQRVEHIAVATPSGRFPVPHESLFRVSRVDVEKRFAGSPFPSGQPDGFILHLQDLPGGETTQPHLVLRLGSSAELCLTPPYRHLPPATARQAVLASVPPGQLAPAIMRHCIGPATARLHKLAMAQPGTPDIVRIGQEVSNPAVSIIVPLYKNLAFMRLQIAALAEDPQSRRADIIYVLDSPEQRGEVEHLLRGLWRLTAMPMTLAIMSRNLGYAAACNAGARLARAPLFLLLNSDVIPLAPGWLKVLMAPFSNPRVTSCGPKLLFDDTSIQHAGLFFERDEDGLWFNRHYHKGLPRHWPAASARRPVPGVTGAALMVRRRLFEWVGGICEDYVIGDYEDSDFCLRMREQGGITLYVPECELFHFERRSIQLHQGYTQTHASLYNRLLHHDRWDDAMAASMAESAGALRGLAA